tara:strand:- start:14161 stop:14523 length:363 start_codon:yes stop_codon:yes gene_type:complete
MRYRSRFEAEIARALYDRNIDFTYEPDKIPYQPKPKVYIPDFYVPDNNFYIEVKGRLFRSDRVKHTLIKEQHPDLEVKFLFQNANQKIYKGSKTTYADWAVKNGFEWSERAIRKEWFNGR